MTGFFARRNVNLEINATPFFIPLCWIGFYSAMGQSNFRHDPWQRFNWLFMHHCRCRRVEGGLGEHFLEGQASLLEVEDDEARVGDVTNMAPPWSPVKKLTSPILLLPLLPLLLPAVVVVVVVEWDPSPKLSTVVSLSSLCVEWSEQVEDEDEWLVFLSSSGTAME
jgi:hypothetical protein